MSHFMNHYRHHNDRDDKNNLNLHRCVPHVTMPQQSNTTSRDMAKPCAFTGKRSRVGGQYSNRTRATQYNPTGKRRRKVNLQKKTLFVPEIGKKVTIEVSAKGLRTINKNGAYKTLKKARLI